MTYLIVSCNELSNGLKNTCSGEFTRPRHHLKVELLLLLLLREFLFGFFFFQLLFPNGPWNCPVINWYVFFITLLLIDRKMLTNVQAARRIAPLKESLPLPMQFEEALVDPVISTVSWVVFVYHH